MPIKYLEIETARDKATRERGGGGVRTSYPSRVLQPFRRRQTLTDADADNDVIHGSLLSLALALASTSLHDRCNVMGFVVYFISRT